eukprot:7182331-Pyramimonas_sp.AAC.1
MKLVEGGVTFTSAKASCRRCFERNSRIALTTGLWGFVCILAVTGTGGPVKRRGGLWGVRSGRDGGGGGGGGTSGGARACGGGGSGGGVTLLHVQQNGGAGVGDKHGGEREGGGHNALAVE